MHIFDSAKRLYGDNAIVAGALPLAVGLALADKMQNKANVIACFFCEGAVAEGEFHGSLNLAKLWQLPALFVCENNGYAMDIPLSESGFVSAGIGAAIGGMRPIVEVMTVNFNLLALDQIVNNAATLRHMSEGQNSVPLVIRMATGAGKQLAAQHSHSL
jgi:TPP-dependent pyruvate/acetoin dehydrogenase alpha subunit